MHKIDPMVTKRTIFPGVAEMSQTRHTQTTPVTGIISGQLLVFAQADRGCARSSRAPHRNPRNSTQPWPTVAIAGAGEMIPVTGVVCV